MNSAAAAALCGLWRYTSVTCHKCFFLCLTLQCAGRYTDSRPAWVVVVDGRCSAVGELKETGQMMLTANANASPFGIIHTHTPLCSTWRIQKISNGDGGKKGNVSARSSLTANAQSGLYAFYTVKGDLMKKKSAKANMERRPPLPLP